jgi:hypothetical protein
MRILMVREKHSEICYDVTSNEDLHKCCLKLIKQRLDDGWYGEKIHLESDYIKDTLGMSEEEIQKFPDSPIKVTMLARLHETKVELSVILETNDRIDRLEKMLETPFSNQMYQSLKYKDRKYNPYEFLFSRSRECYEYEKIQLIEVEKVS